MNTTSLSEIKFVAQSRANLPVVALHRKGDSRADLAATTSSHREAAIQSFGALPLSCQRTDVFPLSNVVDCAAYSWRSLLYQFQKIEPKCVAQLNDMTITCQADHFAKTQLQK